MDEGLHLNDCGTGLVGKSHKSLVPDQTANTIVSGSTSCFCDMFGLPLFSYEIKKIFVVCVCVHVKDNFKVSSFLSPLHGIQEFNSGF